MLFLGVPDRRFLKDHLDISDSRWTPQLAAARTCAALCTLFRGTPRGVLKLRMHCSNQPTIQPRTCAALRTVTTGTPREMSESAEGPAIAEAAMAATGGSSDTWRVGGRSGGSETRAQPPSKASHAVNAAASGAAQAWQQQQAQPGLITATNHSRQPPNRARRRAEPARTCAAWDRLRLRLSEK